MDGYSTTIEGQQGLEKHLSTRAGVLDFVEQLRGGANRRWPFEQLVDIVKALVRNYGAEVYQTYTIPVTSKLTIHRVRVDEENKTFNYATDLGSPPATDIKKFGRCQEPYKPVCYCSLYEDIALAEVNAEAGKQYAIVTYELVKDLIVLPIGELDYFRRTGTTYLGAEIFYPYNPKDHYDKIINDLDKEKTKIRQFIDAFFAEEFITPATDTTYYKFTAALAKILFEHQSWTDKPDAIFYPSVAFRGGYNFAITPDAEKSKLNLMPEQTRIVTIKEVLGYGIYDTEDEKVLKSVGYNGKLEWELISSNLFHS